MGLFLKETRPTRQSSGDGLLKEREPDSQSRHSKHLGSFLRGIGSVLELFPPPPDIRPSLLRGGTHLLLKPYTAPPPLNIPRQTSADALRGDWLRIGGDLRRATERVLAERGRD